MYVTLIPFFISHFGDRLIPLHLSLENHYSSLNMSSINNNKEKMVDDNLCVVCYRAVEIYSIGRCDHPVCYECSTRMRVLCLKNECPICRKEIDMAIFTRLRKPFNDIRTQHMKAERKFNIYFEDDSVMKDYDQLLEHRCPFCEVCYATFEDLKEHVRKKHERFYCQLCVNNLKIFTHERRCYSRHQLGLHRRRGDEDDTSHRGHPLCKFCDQRYIDDDELYRHLRKEHFFCHFCDSDGINQYYDDYCSLREHFRSGHFLCEEGDCQHEEYTAVFRNSLDLQGHIASHHVHNLSRQAARQARTVDIEFSIRPEFEHPGQRGGPHRGTAGPRGRGGAGRRTREAETGQQIRTRDVDFVQNQPPPPVAPTQNININCAQDFPSLGLEAGQAATNPGTPTGSATHSGGGGGNNPPGHKSIAEKLAHNNRLTIRSTSTPSQGPLHEDEYPSLGPSTSLSVSTAVSRSGHTPSTAVRLSVNTQKGRGGARAAQVKIKYSEEDFPQLISPAADFGSHTEPRWGQGQNPGHTAPLREKRGNGVARTAGTKAPGLDDNFPALKTPSQGGQPARSGVWPNRSGQAGRAVENDPKSRRKKRGGATGGPQFGPGMTNAKAGNSKKKPIGLHNIFEDSDNEDSSITRAQANYQAGKAGEYQSVAPPTAHSNVKLISAEEIEKSKNSSSGNCTQVAAQRLPTFDVESDFPSLVALNRPSKPKGRKVDKNNDLPDFPNTKNSFSSQKSDFPSQKTDFPTLDDDLHDFPSLDSDFPELRKSTYMPPGFQSTRMTFTSSLGENYTINPVSNIQHNKVKKNNSKPNCENEFTRKNAIKTSENGFKNTGNVLKSSENASTTKNGKRNNENAPLKNAENSFKSNENGRKTPNNNKSTDKNMHAVAAHKEPDLHDDRSTPDQRGGGGGTDLTYILPDNFSDRNKNLIKTIGMVCDSRSGRFDEFKRLAQLLRADEIHGRDYYEECKRIVGGQTLWSFLPELLCLLPDIRKQQEVLDAYKTVDNGFGCNATFAECEICRQVTLIEELSSHIEKH